MKGKANKFGGELEEVRKRYERRAQKVVPTWKRAYWSRTRIERQAKFKLILSKKFERFDDLRLLEIGAGSGYNLDFFNSIGIPWTNIYANELLEERLIQLRKHCPDEVTILPGDALKVEGGPYDVILASTVFSSILSTPFRQQLAEHLLSLLSSRGVVLWYDLTYRNLLNPDVQGVSANELRVLFQHGSKIEIERVTLTPPVAMLVGPFYTVFAAIPLLRSHLIACIHRDPLSSRQQS